MMRLRQDFGVVASLASGAPEYIFAFGPEHNRMVLGRQDIFHNLDASNIPLRVPEGTAMARLLNGLIQMNGAKHDQQRRLIAPAFARQRLATYLSDIADVTERTLAAWQPGDRRDLSEEMRELTLSIAVKILLGMNPDGAGRTMRRLLWNWVDLVFSLQAVLLPLDLRGFAYRRLLSCAEQLAAEIAQLIEIKRDAGPVGHDILSSLLQAQDDDSTRLSAEEIVGQTNFLFMAGHITTASALTWTLLLLDQHQDILTEVTDECSAILGGSPPTLEQLAELPLLDAVVKESLRLLPPVMWWCRVATAPFVIDRFNLPAGTKIIQSAFITHRDPDLYPQPARFVPSRWRCGEVGQYEYCPFSAGPRMCLGATLASAEIKTILATVLQRCRLELIAGNRVNATGPLLLTPKRSVAVAVRARTDRHSRNEIRGTVRSYVEWPG